MKYGLDGQSRKTQKQGPCPFILQSDTYHFQIIFRSIFSQLHFWSKMSINNIFAGLTKEEIVAQAVLFFIAGFATTSDTMMWLCYELAVNSDIQDKMIQEVDEVTKGVTYRFFL